MCHFVILVHPTVWFTTVPFPRGVFHHGLKGQMCHDWMSTQTSHLCWSCLKKNKTHIQLKQSMILIWWKHVHIHILRWQVLWWNVLKPSFFPMVFLAAKGHHPPGTARRKSAQPKRNAQGASRGDDAGGCRPDIGEWDYCTYLYMFSYSYILVGIHLSAYTDICRHT